MIEEDIGAPQQSNNLPPRPPSLDLDDFAVPTTRKTASLAEESSVTFIGDRESTFPSQQSPTGAQIVVDRDPPPAGPVGWIMKWFGVKRVKNAKIIGASFLVLLVLTAIIIVAREYFISFITIPIPRTTPLIKELPVIE